MFSGHNKVLFMRSFPIFAFLTLFMGTRFTYDIGGRYNHMYTSITVTLNDTSSTPQKEQLRGIQNFKGEYQIQQQQKIFSEEVSETKNVKYYSTATRDEINKTHTKAILFEEAAEIAVNISSYKNSTTPSSSWRRRSSRSRSNMLSKKKIQDNDKKSSRHKSNNFVLKLPKEILAEANKCTINIPKSNHSFDSKKLPKKKPLRSIKWITKEEVLSRGPCLSSFTYWSQYLHFLVYLDQTPMKQGTIHHRSEKGNVGYVYDGYVFTPPDISRWEKNATLWKREGRFPSVEDRVRFYMGRWYDHTNNESGDDEMTATNPFESVEFRRLASSVPNISSNYQLIEVFMKPLLNPFNLDPQQLFLFAEHGFNLNKTLSAKNAQKSRLVQLYTRDIIDLAILHNHFSKDKNKDGVATSPTPVLIKFGDGAPQVTLPFNSTNYPVFSKVRDIIASSSPSRQRFPARTAISETNCQQCGPVHDTIIWPLNRARHFKFASQVPKFEKPWRKKKGVLLWRGGAFSGSMESMKTVLPIELSSFKQRLSLVENHLHSKLVDAKFTDNHGIVDKTYIGKQLKIEEMLQYKYLMSIEGNDVSSGLKWMLFSNSVVFLPSITYESWAMESLLEPFVHYVPIATDMSNVEDMVQWAESHQRECKMIAERSTLFIYDLLFHEDSLTDEMDVLRGIMERYERNFRLRS